MKTDQSYDAWSALGPRKITKKKKSCISSDHISTLQVEMILT